MYAFVDTFDFLDYERAIKFQVFGVDPRRGIAKDVHSLKFLGFLARVVW